ncbi:MAG: hypothetical protein AAB518_00275 [Patescibacteria group bacterium]
MITQRTFLRGLAAALLIAAVFIPLTTPLLAEAQGPVQGPPAPLGNQIQGPPLPAGQLSSNTNDGDADDCDSWFPMFCYGKKLLNWAMRWVLALFLSVTGLIITLMSSLIELMIDMSRDIIGGNPLVQNGFRITLGIANLGFVLAIIIIAFATILRLEKYEMKKTLQRLVIAAVMVNFSLTIAGLFLDFTNVLSYFFIDKITATTLSAGGAPALTSQFGEQMAASLNIQDLINIKDSTGSTGALVPVKDLADLIADFYANFVSLFIALVFSILILIIFGALAFMLVVRYIYLTVLIILMPLAWLFWTIPDLSKYWSKWWNKFFQWTFFLPTVTFFLYLAMLSSRGVDAVVASQVQQQFGHPFGAAVAVDTSVLQGSGVTGLLQLIVKLGLFVAALMVGQSLGIAGAEGGIGIAKAMGKKFTGGKSPYDWLKNKAEKSVTGFGGGKDAEGKEKRKYGIVPFLASGFMKTAPGFRGIAGSKLGAEVISKPLGREIAKQEIKKAEDMREAGAKLGAETTTSGDLYELRRRANKWRLVFPGMGGRNKGIMEARLAAAEIDKKGFDEMTPQGIPAAAFGGAGATAAFKPSEQKRYAKATTKIDSLLKRKGTIEKEEKEEEEEEKEEKRLERIAHKVGKHLGHGKRHTEKEHEEGDEKHGGEAHKP